MSDFAVTVREIGAITPHPNADRLELARLKDLAYPFVVGKGEFAVGQQVVYFPLDSILQPDLASRLKLPVKEDQPFRVRSVRLRGEWSEGVLASLPVIGLDPKLAYVGQDLTDVLGVEKYQPAEYDGKDFRSRQDALRPFPPFVYKYDIENLQRFPHLFDVLRDQIVIVTEKLEGSHWWAKIDRDEVIHVGQRNFAIKRTEEDALEGMHPFWQAFYDGGLDDLLRTVGRYYRGYDVTFRGEIIGTSIQKNYYGLDKRVVYLFDIELNGRPVDAETFYYLTRYRTTEDGMPIPRTAPIVGMGVLGALAANVEELIMRAHGASSVNPAKLREGIVVKPMVEGRDGEVGRLFFKIRDAEYMAQ